MHSQPKLTDTLLTVDGQIATLILNRDDVRNELTGTHIVEDIVRTTEWINSDHSISVLILTGAGKAFSAGGNIKHMLHREGAFGGTVYEVQKKYREGIQRMAQPFINWRCHLSLRLTDLLSGLVLILPVCATSALRQMMQKWVKLSLTLELFRATVVLGYCSGWSVIRKLPNYPLLVDYSAPRRRCPWGWFYPLPNLLPC